MIYVNFTDGSSATYTDRASAEEGISEEVFGCDFAVNVESIESDDGVDYSCVFSLHLKAEG